MSLPSQCRDETPPITPAAAAAARPVQIPTHSGQVFRFDAGRDSDLMPATVPN
jgi:hypothetical protein